MTEQAKRHSPITHLLRGAQWRHLPAADADIAMHLSDPDAEREAARSLGICDLSALRKVGLKGPSVEAWVAQQNLPVPPNMFDTAHTGDRSLVVRTGSDEFFIEQHPAGPCVNTIEAALADATSGVYRVWREDATFVLTGANALEVMAQTCGVDFSTAERDRLIMSRVAGVSCSILPETIADLPVCYRVWCDPSFAATLWEALVQITEDIGGRVIGAACLYPGLPE